MLIEPNNENNEQLKQKLPKSLYFVNIPSQFFGERYILTIKHLHKSELWGLIYIYKISLTSLYIFFLNLSLRKFSLAWYMDK